MSTCTRLRRDGDRDDLAPPVDSLRAILAAHGIEVPEPDRGPLVIERRGQQTTRHTYQDGELGRL